MDASEIISAFGEKLGIGLEFDADNVCSFEADGMVVTFHNLREIDEIVIMGDLGEPPPWNLEHLYRAMLEANHLFNATFGATISFNAESGHFALCRALPCKALDGESFFAAAEHFVSALELWTRLVRDYRGGAGESDAGKEELDTSSFLRV